MFLSSFRVMLGRRRQQLPLLPSPLIFPKITYFFAFCCGFDTFWGKEGLKRGGPLIWSWTPRIFFSWIIRSCEKHLQSAAPPSPRIEWRPARPGCFRPPAPYPALPGVAGRAVPGSVPARVPLGSPRRGASSTRSTPEACGTSSLVYTSPSHFLGHVQSLEPSTGISKTSSLHISNCREENKSG